WGGGGVEERRVVERAALGLVDADGEPDSGFAGGGSDPLGTRARDLDRLLREPRPDPRSLRAVCELAHPAVRWVDRNERLGEQRELRAVCGRLARERGELLDRRVAVEDDRLRLDTGNPHTRVH